MRLVLSFVFLLFSSVTVAQSVQWNGVVQSAGTYVNLTDANFTCISLNKRFTTDKKGNFEIIFAYNERDFTVLFEISHIGYKDKRISLHRSDFVDGILEMNVFLESKTEQIESVNISIEKKIPDTICGRKDYNVGDFCFIGDKTLLLIYTKEKRWKRVDAKQQNYYQGCKLILIDDAHIAIDSVLLDGLYIEFYSGYFDKVFLTGVEKNYLVNLTDDRVVLELIDKQLFDENVKPVIDSIGDMVIASNFNPNIPLFDYYVLELKDSSYRKIHEVSDETILSVFRTEYKYLDGKGKLNAYRYELKTGIDKEIIAAFMSGFANSMFVKPLYAPAFTQGDTLIVFDHYKDMIFKYDGNQQCIDSLSINYHHTSRRLRWKKEILFDEELKQYYALFEQDGFSYLYWIDIDKGTVIDTFKLYYKYAEKIKVKNGKADYIYRPFESSQKKFLYEEDL